MRVGILAPMPTEAECLGLPPRCNGGPHDLGAGAWAWISGMGPERAARGAEALLEAGAECLVSFGVAAGLDPALRPGDLVLPALVLTAGGAELAADAPWRERLAQSAPRRPSDLSLMESATLVASAADKALCRSATGAGALDMESAAVAAAANRAGVPFVAVRAICDPAQMAIPRSSAVAVDAGGRLRRLALLGALARRPADLGELLALGRAFRAAQASLRELARRAGPRLLAP